MGRPQLSSLLPLGVAWIVASASLTCGSSIRTAAQGPHTVHDTPVEVPEPPPEPAQVDPVGPAPSPEAVWVDGQWTWRGHRWVWVAGSWQIAPPDSYYSYPSLVRIPVEVFGTVDGGARGQALLGYGFRLMFISGHWHRRSDGALVPAVPASSAKPGN